MSEPPPGSRRSDAPPAASPLYWSEARFYALAEASGAVVWRMPASGEFEVEEPRWEAFTGQPFEEYRGWGWTGAIHPDDRERVISLWRRALDTGEPYEAEYRLRDREGRYHVGRSRAAAVRSPAGEVVEWVGMIEDVTEKREAAAALRARTAELQAITDNTEDVITRFDREHRFLFVNPAIEWYTGLPPEAFLGNTKAEVGLPPEQVALWEGHLDEVFETGRPHRFEFTLDGPAGRYVMLCALVPERANGSPVETVLTVLTVTRDITELKTMELALRDSEARTRQTLESIADGFFSLGRDWRFTYLNAAAERLLRRPREELLGQNVWEAFPPAVDTLFKSEYERAVREGVPVRFTEYYPDLRGWFEVRAFPYEDGLSVYFTEVTERVEAERVQRELTDRLRALSHRLVEVQEQERRALARELHDELGQELTALKLTLEAALVSPAPRVPPLRGALDTVLRLQSQVRELSLDLRPSMLDDLGLLPALGWLIGRYEQRMGLTVGFTSPERLPKLRPEVATAAFRIVQESLTNVVRHAGVAEASVVVGLDGEHLLLEVADRGAGFEAAHPHRRASSGLSGMAERAVLLGGDVEIDTSPGGGTRLRARLPLAPALP